MTSASMTSASMTSASMTGTHLEAANGNTSSVAIAAVTDVVDAADAGVNLLELATARDAAVGLPIVQEMTDNYGDPEAFVKYIVRRPPILA